MNALLWATLQLAATMQPQAEGQTSLRALPNIDCRDSELNAQELLSLLDAELKSSRVSSTRISVYCHSGSTASIEVSQAGDKKFTSLNYSSLPFESRARATSLAVAELLLLPEDSEEPSLEVSQETAPDESKDAQEADQVVLLEETPLMATMPSSSSASSSDPAADPLNEEAPARATQAFLQAGPVLRSYMNGGQLAGAVIDLTWLGISVGAEVLAGGNGYKQNANSFNAYLGYDFLFDTHSSLRGVLGARACGGMITSSNEGSGYLGATAFGGADLHLGRVWRTRLVAELGHAGWSNNATLSQLQGFFLGASLLIGADPDG